MKGLLGCLFLLLLIDASCLQVRMGSMGGFEDIANVFLWIVEGFGGWVWRIVKEGADISLKCVVSWSVEDGC